MISLIDFANMKRQRTLKEQIDYMNLLIHKKWSNADRIIIDRDNADLMIIDRDYQRTSYLTLSEYLNNIIRTNPDGHQSLGCVGHESMGLWIDLLTKSKIEWVRLFWEAFSFIEQEGIEVGSHNDNDGDGTQKDELDMWEALKLLRRSHSDGTILQRFNIDNENVVHQAFVAWENALVDQHILFINLQRQSEQKCRELKISSMEAMSMIEQILHNDYDLLNPTTESANEALEKIMEIAFFADKEDRTKKTE